jgi:hypothetical protein
MFSGLLIVGQELVIIYKGCHLNTLTDFETIWAGISNFFPLCCGANNNNNFIINVCIGWAMNAEAKRKFFVGL